MSVKHKVLKDFQLVTSDKKIITLKAKTIIEDFTYKSKGETVKVEKEIIDNNQDYFSFIDWKEELNTHLKLQKVAQPAIVTKKLVPFIETMFLNKTQEVVKEVKVENTSNEEVIKKELELDSKLRKVAVTEQYLEDQLKSLSDRQNELEIKEKSINDRESQLNSLQVELQERSDSLQFFKTSIDERSITLAEKEDNLSNYIDRNILNDAMNNIRNQGFDVSLFENIIRRL